MTALPTTLDWHRVSVGDEVTPLVVDVTATLVVSGALATRDFMPVHHDRDYANGQGAPDIFMNILATNAYCTRFLTDWAGPNAMLRRLAIRLGVPVMPGCTLTFTGEVSATGTAGDDGTVEVTFRATNELGDHVTGTAELGLPLA